jgi:hypothetical protein
VLDLLIPLHIKKVLVYPEGISMRWGTTKLRSFCTDTLGAEPQPETGFLFTNKKQDTLLLYLVCDGGDETITKKRDRAGRDAQGRRDDQARPERRPGGGAAVAPSFRWRRERA